MIEILCILCSGSELVFFPVIKAILGTGTIFISVQCIIRLRCIGLFLKLPP